MTDMDVTAVEAAKVVDARAMACPGPLLEAKKSMGNVKVGEVLEIWSGDKKSMGNVKVGEVLEIWSGDSKTKEDMPRWCKKVGHEYLGDAPGEGYDRLFIRRMK
jgi:TusA-related sulfurtransferase